MSKKVNTPRFKDAESYTLNDSSDPKFICEYMSLRFNTSLYWKSLNPITFLVTVSIIGSSTYLLTESIMEKPDSVLM